MHLLISLYILHNDEEQLAKLDMQLSNNHILLTQTTLLSMTHLSLHLQFVHIVW